MVAVTVRKLPEETHRALKARAAQHNRSTEAEIRVILENAVRPKNRLQIGSELAAFGQQFEDIEFNTTRNSDPIKPALFE